jgi:hypothetical protein
MPTNGKQIIKDAVAVCSYLSDYGVDRSNAIASTHSYVFDEKTPWNVIREVADACQTSGGAVGFDGYVDPAGNLWVFARGANNSTVDLTDKILRYKIDYDTYRVKNKIKVYGACGRRFPDSDWWTENLQTQYLWTGSGSVSFATPAPVGNYYVIINDSVNNPYWLQRPFTGNNNAIITPIGIGFKTSAKKFRFYMYREYALTKAVLRLLAPDTSNYFEFDFTEQAVSNNVYLQWGLVEVDLALDRAVLVGNPDYGNIEYFRFVFTRGADVSPIRIDDPHLAELPYTYTAEYSTSQSLYGVRMPEPIVDDSLLSDDDCAKKAQSLLAYYKDKVTTLTLTTFGNNGFKPGDMVHVVLSNDNIDGYFRILEITHKLQDVYWETELLLSNEPIMIDYIFRSMFEAQKLAAKK